MAGKQRMSYFGEIRQRYNDPSYFNNVSNRPDIIEDIRKNVKRIIKDAANGNIIEQDFMYFQSVNLVTICMDVCNENISLINTQVHALQYYINNVLMHNYQPLYVSRQPEHSNAARLFDDCTAKLGIWMASYNAFNGIMRGGNPIQELSTLIQLKQQINTHL